MLSLVDVLMCDVLHEQNLRCVLRDLVTENADLQSRVVELQSRHQVKGSVLVYERPFTHFCFAEWCPDQGQGVS